MTKVILATSQLNRILVKNLSSGKNPQIPRDDIQLIDPGATQGRLSSLLKGIDNEQEHHLVFTEDGFPEFSENLIEELKGKCTLSILVNPWGSCTVEMDGKTKIHECEGSFAEKLLRIIQKPDDHV